MVRHRRPTRRRRRGHRRPSRTGDPCRTRRGGHHRDEPAAELLHRGGCGGQRNQHTQRSRRRAAERPTGSEARVIPVTAGTGTTSTASDDDQLRTALSSARPGDTIRLAAGRYQPLTITGNGTAAAPITLTADRGAVIDAGSGSGYGLHIQNATYWQVVGLTITGGGKGIVTDNTQHVLLDALDVGRTGEEGVHFRANSSTNTLQRSTIHDTGLQQPGFGEGAYIGSARSNWKTISGGQPDLSMNNRIVDNTFQKITAENVDVKEETSGALITGNRFDGSATSGANYADSVVDVKGHATTITDNITTGDSPALKNIIETHVITDPATSGCGNTIAGNTVQGFIPAGAVVAIDKKCVGPTGTGDSSRSTGGQN